jgi:hypothetical protein
MESRTEFVAKNEACSGGGAEGKIAFVIVSVVKLKALARKFRGSENLLVGVVIVRVVRAERPPIGTAGEGKTREAGWRLT